MQRALSAQDVRRAYPLSAATASAAESFLRYTEEALDDATQQMRCCVRQHQPRHAVFGAPVLGALVLLAGAAALAVLWLMAPQLIGL